MTSLVSPPVPCLSREHRKAAASGHLQSPLQQSGHLVVAVALVVHEDAVVVAVLPRELQVREELLVELGALVRLMRLVLLVRSWCALGALGAWCALDALGALGALLMRLVRSWCAWCARCLMRS